MKRAAKIFSFCLTAVISANALAEMCPKIAEIQNNQLGQWQVFDANSGEPISAKRLAKYEKQVDHFAEATYYEGAPEGPAQCYYDGKDEYYHLDTYLARQGLLPDLSKGEWKASWGGNYSCQKNIFDCLFV